MPSKFKMILACAACSAGFNVALEADTDKSPPVEVFKVGKLRKGGDTCGFPPDKMIGFRSCELAGRASENVTQNRIALERSLTSMGSNRIRSNVPVIISLEDVNRQWNVNCQCEIKCTCEWGLVIWGTHATWRLVGKSALSMFLILVLWTAGASRTAQAQVSKVLLELQMNREIILGDTAAVDPLNRFPVGLRRLEAGHSIRHPVSTTGAL